MMIRLNTLWTWCAVGLLVAATASAQSPAPTPDPQAPVPPVPAVSAPPPQPAPVTADPDSRLDPLQPDFTLASLPTTLRMPEHKLSFILTHRFDRPLGRGDFSDLLSDFFGFDNGAQIGLGLRYGLRKGTQIGIYRTSDRSIELFGQQSLIEERNGRPVTLDALVTFEGKNNYNGQKMSTLGLIASRKVGHVAAVYAEPLYVFNSNPIPGASGSDKNTLMLGLGGRVRVRPVMYLVAEYVPRLAGYKPGTDQATFGVEVRAGGHTFQINFSDGLGTTLGQLAGGGIDSHTWVIGFNLSRKFF